MKIFLARSFLKINDIEFNYKKIIEIYDSALKDECDLLIFPEMAITGFPIDDNILNQDFIKKSDSYIEEIVDYTKGKKTRILLGCPYFINSYTKNEIIKKSQLFNSVILIGDGYIDAVSSKTTISKNNLFNEYKYFDTETVLKSISYEDDNFDVLIADDMEENKNIFFIKERDTDFIVCLDSEIPENMKTKKNQLIKIAKWTKKNIIYMNTLSYDPITEIKMLGEIFIINDIGEITFSNTNINEDLLQFKTSIQNYKLAIENKQYSSQTCEFIDIIAKNNSEKNIIVEINKKINTEFNKNIKPITFEKKFSNDKIDFIDKNNFFKKGINFKLDQDLKRIIIDNLYKNYIYFKY